MLLESLLLGVGRRVIFCVYKVVLCLYIEVLGIRVIFCVNIILFCLYNCWLGFCRDNGSFWYGDLER